MNSNKNKKRNGINSLSPGSHLSPLEEMNQKHPPQRCQPKDSSSKTQHLAFPLSQEAVLPSQGRCSTKVVIPQLTDLIPRHRHHLVRFPGRRHDLLSIPFYIIRLFLPGTQHDFTGTIQSEYFLTVFFKILCMMQSALQNSYRVEQVIKNRSKVKNQSSFCWKT